MVYRFHHDRPLVLRQTRRSEMLKMQTRVSLRVRKPQCTSGTALAPLHILSESQCDKRYYCHLIRGRSHNAQGNSNPGLSASLPRQHPPPDKDRAPSSAELTATCRIRTSQSTVAPGDSEWEPGTEASQKHRLLPEAMPPTDCQTPWTKCHIYYSKQLLLFHQVCSLSHLNKQLLKWNLMIQNR